MSSWKKIQIDSSIPCWEAVLTDADGKEAGRFTVDVRFGYGLLRFVQGVLRVMNAPIAFLTAYDSGGGQFPLKMPVLADARANDDNASSLAPVQLTFNNFVDSGKWTPVFENSSGARWTVEFFSVDTTETMRENSAVVPAVRSASRTRFRKSFLGGS